MVDLSNFVRAETDTYLKKDSFGVISHRRTPPAIDEQTVVRMNRDTLYSSGVFDLDAAPVTVTLPDAGKRFMSLQIISQDHHTLEVAYAPARLKLTREKVGTRYVYVLIRTLVDADDPGDVATANAAQDAIKVEQASAGSFEIPDWDQATLNAVRNAVSGLAPFQGSLGPMFGNADTVDPLAHLIGTAIGWGGNPDFAAVYQSDYPKENDGLVVHRLTVRDVPVDGFWSVSVYDEKGFFQENEPGVYSINSLTAATSEDGSVEIQFGGCGEEAPNCVPIMKGWNYTARLYRPRPEILDGSWVFPKAVPIE